MSGVEVGKERFLVWQMGEGKWIVLSMDSTSGKPKQYCVAQNGYRFLCNCPHFLKNSDDVNFACKHIVAVLQTIGTQTEVEKRRSGNGKWEKEIEERIKKLESRVEDLEIDLFYTRNPAELTGPTEDQYPF